MGVDRESELSGGGLVRSHDGWSKVLSMRKQGLKEQGDERIPGSGFSIAESAHHTLCSETTVSLTPRACRTALMVSKRGCAPIRKAL